MPATPLRSALTSCVTLALAACGPEPATQPQQPGVPPILQYDYGTVPHGEVREHDFVVDVAAVLGDGWIPLSAQVDCSCARATMSVRNADGTVHELLPQRSPPALREGQRLVVHLRLDTGLKEAADLGPVPSNGTIVLQKANSMLASDRVHWPIRFRFAIDAPVRLRPYAVLDFARVPVSSPGRLVMSLASDLPGRPVAFGPARCEDPRLQVELEPQEDMTMLRATFTPTELTGSFRALVTIDTDLPDGYLVKLFAVGKVVPDLEAVPMPKLSLRTDLSRTQPEGTDLGQYLLVTDHDRRRPAEFRVARLVDSAGRDASRSFAVRFEPVPGEDRSRRMFVRYTGGCDGEFRGQIVLAKDPDDGPFLSIELVALHVPGPP